MTITWALIAGVAFHATPAADPQEARTLHFPPDRKVGILNLIEPDGQEDELDYLSWPCRTYEARGTVTVPADKLLKLTLTETGWHNLAWLSQLNPDDLFSLEFPYADRQAVLALPDDRVMTRIKRLQGLKELSLYYTNITARGLKQLAGLSHLESLKLPTGIDDQGINEVAVAQLPNLRALHLYRHEATDEGLAVLAEIPSLEELTLTSRRMSDAAVAHLARLPKLCSLRLWGPRLTDQCLVHLQHVPSLKSIDLSGTDITDAGALFLAQLTQLEELNVWNTLLTDEGLAHLANLGSLKTLVLHGMGGNRIRMSDEALVHLGRISTLEHIALPSDGITDRGLAHLVDLKHLRHLSAGGSTNSPLTNAALKSISALRALETLRIGGKALSDEGLEYLVGLNDLQILNIFEIGDFTGRGVAALGKLRSLRSLCIHFHQGERPVLADLKHLNALSNLAQLRIAVQQDGTGLDVSGLKAMQDLEIICPLTDQDLATLPQLTQLGQLALRGEFTDEAVAPLASLPELWRLSLHSPYISDQTLCVLSQCPKLWRLSISGGFTDKGLLALAGYPALRLAGIGSDRPFSQEAWNQLASIGPEMSVRPLKGTVIE